MVLTVMPIEQQVAGICLRGLKSYPAQSRGLPLFGLHGWMDNAASFLPLMHLMPDREFLAWELAGHGWSDHRSKHCRYHLIDYVFDVVELIRRCNRECVLVGHSLGGVVAAYTVVALGELDHVKGLVLIDSVGSAPGHAIKTATDLRYAVDHWWAWLEKLTFQDDKVVRNSFRSIDDMIAMRVTGDIPLSQEAATLICERAAKLQSDGSWIWRTDTRLKHPSAVRLAEEQVLNLLEAISVPTCLLLAKNSFIANFAPLQRRIEALKCVEVHQIEGSHHMHMDSTTSPIVAAIVDMFVDALSDATKSRVMGD